MGRRPSSCCSGCAQLTSNVEEGKELSAADQCPVFGSREREGEKKLWCGLQRLPGPGLQVRGCESMAPGVPSWLWLRSSLSSGSVLLYFKDSGSNPSGDFMSM